MLEKVRHPLKSLLRRALRMPPEKRLYVDKTLFYRYAKHRLGPEAVYVEIGAATGKSAKIWTEYLGLRPDRCHLVEACPTNARLLQEKLPGYRVYNYAAMDRCGEVALSIVDKPADEGSSRSNSLNEGALRAKSKLPIRQVMVQGVTMGELFERAGISRCDLLYMNCEGAEYDILNGDVSFLDRVGLFYLDMHMGLFRKARTEREMLEMKAAAYDLLASRGFTQIGGHQRKHIFEVSNIHLTSFWENDRLSSDQPRLAPTQ